MKILIINNKLDSLPHFRKYLKGYDFDIINFHNIKRDDYKKYDYIILSWGKKYEVNDNPWKYLEELELIKECNKPILWICLGHQLIAYAFWEKLSSLDKYYKWITEISVLKQEKIFESMNKKFEANIDHRRVVSSCKKFYVIWISDQWIEAIKHKNRNLYWIQFHPEIVNSKANSSKIIENFLKI